MGFVGLAMLVLAARGPHCKRGTWVGWEGGWELRKGRVKVSEEVAKPETEKVEVEEVEEKGHRDGDVEAGKP